MPLPNKNGEPHFQLKFKPLDEIAIKWEQARTTTSEFTITNTTDFWHSYKVKCTDNSLFRVRPPLGFIEPHSSFTIRVFLPSFSRPDKNNHDYFVIYHTRCSEADAKAGNARRVWYPPAVPQGVLRMPIRVDIEGSSAPSDSVESAAIPSPSVTPPPTSSLSNEA